MAVAFQCERCQSFGPNEPVAIVTVNSKEPMPTGKGSKEYDLCGRCLDDLREFLTPIPEEIAAPESFPASSIDVPFGGSRYQG